MALILCNRLRPISPPLKYFANFLLHKKNNIPKILQLPHHLLARLPPNSNHNIGNTVLAKIHSCNYSPSILHQKTALALPVAVTGIQSK